MKTKYTYKNIPEQSHFFKGHEGHHAKLAL